MTDLLSIAIDHRLSPMVLFFVLGILAARLGSDLEIPQAIGTGSISKVRIANLGFPVQVTG